MKRILVAIEFDDQVDRILEIAEQIGIAHEAQIWLLHASAPDPDFVGYSAGPDSVRDDRANELREEHKKIQEFGKVLSNKGLEVNSLLVQGATIDTIKEEIEKLSIDLLIVGHHEQGVFVRMIKGSVAESLVRSVSIPVLIIPS